MVHSVGATSQDLCPGTIPCMARPPLVCAGALIFDPAGRLFLQRRAPGRSLFPLAWDIVGGHVEPGETLEQTLAREITEETGWRLARILADLPRLAWTGDDGLARIEYDYLVEVAGDLSAPRLAPTEHTEFRLVPPGDLEPLLREHRAAGPELDEWVELVTVAAARLTDPPSGPDPLLATVARLAAQIERVFVGAMRRMPDLAGGRELVRGFGGSAAVGGLIEFRTALGWPGRWVTEPEALEVARYRDHDQLRTAVRGHAEAGMLELDGSGAFRATARGHEFLTALAGHQARALDSWWADAPVRRVAPLLRVLLDAAAATGGPAWHAMAPAYEPAGAPTALLVLNRLGTLRYHRADAHARAWRAAGQTAAGMAALPPGPQRDAIEVGTNRAAAAPYRALGDAGCAELLAALAGFPG
jgi:8-oxo-dGTP pyrophosphatase MutT (NUDIX family)